MRTNIELDDHIVTEAMKLSGAKTKREVVDMALHALVRQRRELRIKEYRGKLPWEGDLDAMRRD